MDPKHPHVVGTVFGDAPAEDPGVLTCLVSRETFGEIRQGLTALGVFWQHFDTDTETIRIGPLELMQTHCPCALCEFGSECAAAARALKRARAAGFSQWQLIKEMLHQYRNAPD